jgi:pyruvate, orthophosphate dikinase
MSTYIYDFAAGHMGLKALLGGKGANLAEMVRLGLPVPPGFTITTEACRAFLAAGSMPQGLHEQVDEHLNRLESSTGLRLGDAEDPLLVSVRSGAQHSMPGMMDTVLNVGLNDVTVVGLARRSGDERFAWDCYRRLVQMFGRTVLGIDGARFEEALRTVGVEPADGTADQLRAIVTEFQAVVARETGSPFPQDPREQVHMAVRAVFQSWNGERARIYRRRKGIADDLGTAVNVCTMVFGNLGADSGTGVAFTRDPATGQRGIYGDYLPHAQGEDVVSGIRNTLSLDELAEADKASYDELARVAGFLERHYRDLCDIEFTIERGRLWILQTRVGQRTPEAAFRIAVQLVEEGIIDLDEALCRVEGDQLARLMFPRFDLRTGGPVAPLVRGTGASPGAAVGKAVFDSATAVAWAEAGVPVVLVRRETDPDDLPGLIAAQGVLTGRGGKTSHAAVVARGMGKSCVCAAKEMDIDEDGRFFTVGGTTVGEGAWISIDGTTGEVYLGEVPVAPSPVAEYLEGRADSVAVSRDPLVAAVDGLMTHADRVARLRVRANADTVPDAERARRFGAGGIGLCRTEHMFLGERRVHIERLVLADTQDERAAVLAELLPMQRGDFTELLTAMDGLPVTIRLLDPPLHEFLPDATELAVQVALAESRGEADPHAVRLLQAVQRLREHNPMLGLRGVRLGLVIPELFAMQVRAVGEAVVERLRSGGDPRAEIMVPLVGAVQELRIVRERAEQVLADVGRAAQVAISCPIGTMVEVPRAALTAAQIARAADFFSFGTNDLTQMTWGFSRDDAESGFFPTYLAQDIFPASPFGTLDTDGVGRLVAQAAAEGRDARPALKLGVCGEHGGDPASIRFFHETGLDYVSCSPFRVPIARLEAGRVAVQAGGGAPGGSPAGSTAGSPAGAAPA